MLATGGDADLEWDIPRPAATCRHLLHAARLHAIDVETCLSGTGLTVNAIEDHTTEVQAGQELAVLRNVLACASDVHALAADVGLQYNFANMGILGYALLASPTIGAAVDVACRYAMLSSTFLQLTRTDTEVEAVVEFDDRQIPADVREFMITRDLYAMTKMVPLLVGASGSPVVVRVELPGVDIPSTLLEFQNLVIEVDATSTRTALILPPELLRRAMPAADAATAAACLQQCEDLLHTRRQRRGLAALVRTRLIRDPGQVPSMVTIAGEMCITERTLHRRLAAEHTSYRSLVDEVRATLAIALLSSGLTVEQTGRQLGYSETAAFTRAFSRWTGLPPSMHRRRSS